MARVGRIAGAILAETAGSFFLVGNPKEPCDWLAHGFEPPGEIDAQKRPFIKLSPRQRVLLSPPWLTMDLEGDSLPRLLVERLVIERNGSVSERLWRLVTQADDEADAPPDEAIDARWLAGIPAPIWRVVRDTVLRCT
jgi:hypothetical protein